MNCGDCKHSGTYVNDLEKPKNRKFLFWELEPYWVEKFGYEIKQNEVDNYVPCHYNPETIQKKKNSWCSHWENK